MARGDSGFRVAAGRRGGGDSQKERAAPRGERGSRYNLGPHGLDAGMRVCVCVCVGGITRGNLRGGASCAFTLERVALFNAGYYV